MEETTSSERLVRNQLLFREVNQRIREVAGRFGILDAALFVCECGRGDCADAVELDLHDYDDVRSRPGSFVVLPGHEGHEPVVARQKRYLVVSDATGQQAHLQDRNV